MDKILLIGSGWGLRRIIKRLKPDTWARVDPFKQLPADGEEFPTDIISDLSRKYNLVIVKAGSTSQELLSEISSRIPTIVYGKMKDIPVTVIFWFEHYEKVLSFIEDYYKNINKNFADPVKFQEGILNV